MSNNKRAILRVAIETYGSDDLWIDEDAEVAQVGEDGYWVRAEVWIPMADVPANTLPTDDPRPF